MRKLLLGLFIALSLIGCQQPTIDPSRPEVELEEETIEDEQQEEIVEESTEESTDEDREEQLLKINVLKESLNQCKAKLLKDKEQFKVNYDKAGDYFKFVFVSNPDAIGIREKYADERNGTIIAEFTCDLSDMEYTQKQHIEKGETVIANDFNPYIEQIKKDIEDLETRFNEIQYLLKEIEGFEDEFTTAVWDYSVGEYREEIDLADIPERVAVVEYRANNLDASDIQDLSGKYRYAYRDILMKYSF